MRVAFFTLLLLLPPSILNARIAFGNEVLRDMNYLPLKDKRIAILTNPTGVFMDTMRSLVDTMVDEGLEVVCVFSPEHGFRGGKDIAIMIISIPCYFI